MTREKKVMKKLLAAVPVVLPDTAPPPARPKKKGHELSGEQLAALQAGKVRIDARLDLHHLTQAAAHDVLDRFMHKQIARGARLLLIITGKGRGGIGVLRQNLPGWLMAGEHRQMILTLHPAHQKHGGDGATYVLLRR